jgi:hypothetical protein
VTPRGTEAEGLGSIQDDIARLVANAERSLREQKLSDSRLVGEFEVALSLLGRAKDYDELRQRVRGYLKDVEKWQGVLSDILTGLEAWD